MTNDNTWIQDFVLNRTGDEIFYAPIIITIVGLLLFWLLPSITRFKVVSWFISFVFLVSALGIWFYLWDWRAETYSQELSDAIVDTELIGTTIESSDINADAFGSVDVYLDIEYDLGFAEVFMIEDVENLINYLVLDYDLNDDSYLHTMRDFQNFRIHLSSSQNEQLEEILSYERSTLIHYANNVVIREIAGDNELGETGYQVIPRDGGAWRHADEQATDGGISLESWRIGERATGALESINNLSCAVLNGFSECNDDPTEHGMGPADTHHSVALSLSLVFGVIIVAIILEIVIRLILSRRIREVDNERVIGSEEEFKEYEPKHVNKK